MLQDSKLAEESEANQINKDDTNIDDIDLSNVKTMKGLICPKRREKVKENKYTLYSCGSIKNNPWLFNQQEGNCSKILEKVIFISFGKYALLVFRQIQG